MSTVTLLDYGAGNVRSVRNAIRALGFEVRDVASPEEILTAEKLVFPGVGAFGSAIGRLQADGYFEPLRRRLLEGKPFFGICIGLQVLFEGSEESLGATGLGIIRGQVRRFPAGALAVPHMGWNGINVRQRSALFDGYGGEKLYFVHSYRGVPDERDRDWVLATTNYGGEFVSAVQKGNVAAVQFHPEKSGAAGLAILRRLLTAGDLGSGPEPPAAAGETRLARRIIACLDVRTNDAGDLVVTKGDQYDVRHEGEVRNLGKPVDLARRYYEEGADEITFLNITSFREEPLADQPMLEVLRRTSENVFVPLTIGGGIRGYTDPSGRRWTRAGGRQRVLPLRRRQDLDRLGRGVRRRGVPADREGHGRVLHRADRPRLRQPGGRDLGGPAARLGALARRRPAARSSPPTPPGRTASASAGSSAPSGAAARGGRSTR